MEKINRVKCLPLIALGFGVLLETKQTTLMLNAIDGGYITKWMIMLRTTWSNLIGQGWQCLLQLKE